MHNNTAPSDPPLASVPFLPQKSGSLQFGGALKEVGAECIEASHTLDPGLP